MSTRKWSRCGKANRAAESNTAASTTTTAKVSHSLLMTYPSSRQNFTTSSPRRIVLGDTWALFSLSPVCRQTLQALQVHATRRLKAVRKPHLSHPLQIDRRRNGGSPVQFHA